MVKMKIFVLPTKKSFVISFWTFFKYLGNHSELEKPKLSKLLLLQWYLSNAACTHAGLTTTYRTKSPYKSIFVLSRSRNT